MNGQIKNYLILLLACFLWGTTPPCGRYLKDSMSPILITGARFYVVALILFVTVYLTSGVKGFKLCAHDLKVLIVMGLVGIFLHNTFLFEGLRYTPASNAALIECIGPTFTSVLAFLFIGERIGKKGWFSIFVSCFGAIYIVCKGTFSDLIAFRLNIGELYIIACEAMWSCYVIISWKLTKNINALAVTAWSGLFGAIFCTVFGAATDALVVYKITTMDVIAFLVLSILAAVVSFASWNYAIGKVGASKGGTFVYLIPVFGVFFGITFLGEAVNYQEFIGGFIVIVGMIISLRSKLSVVDCKKSVSTIKKELLLKEKNKNPEN